MRAGTVRRGLGAVVMAFAVTIATFGSFASPAKSAEMIDQVTWALPDFPDVLFVPHAWSTNTGGIMSLAQEGLLAFDDSLALTTGVAESWKQLDDLTYTCLLYTSPSPRDS